MFYVKWSTIKASRVENHNPLLGILENIQLKAAVLVDPFLFVCDPIRSVFNKCD